ncbi:MAG: hypothetical protein HZB55_19915 [Deltaproteobacteria bacterium]|nr:hypothetical protein [Deltaproteobacteria bacterium]
MPSRSWWRWMTAGLLVVVTSVGAASWLRGRERERAHAEGLRIAGEAAALGRQGRAAGSAGRRAEAADLLNRAVRLLRGARGVSGDPFAALLVDLASLRLSQDPRDEALRSSARALLAEARRVPDLTSSLRARIDRDLGSLCLLDGELQAAEAWYAEAQRLDPGDARSRDRLALLRSTRPPEPTRNL